MPGLVHCQLTFWGIDFFTIHTSSEPDSTCLSRVNKLIYHSVQSNLARSYAFPILIHVCGEHNSIFCLLFYSFTRPGVPFGWIYPPLPERNLPHRSCFSRTHRTLGLDTIPNRAGINCLHTSVSWLVYISQPNWITNIQLDHRPDQHCIYWSHLIFYLASPREITSRKYASTNISLD